MARTDCHVCLVSSFSGHCKNPFGRGNASCGHITKLEEYTFLRYLWGTLTDSTVDFLVLTSLDQLLFILKMLYAFFKKQASLMRRWMVLSEPSPSVSDPCLSDSILSFVMLSVTVCKSFCAECLYAEFRYIWISLCWVSLIWMSLYWVSLIRMSLCWWKYCYADCRQSERVMLSVVDLNVVMHYVVAPLNSFECCGSPWPYALLHQSGGRNNSGLEF